MDHRERVMAALAGAPLDRPPISFWGHFYHRESTAEDLVAATLEFQKEYDWDWVKLNPRKHYHVEPWGVRYRYSGRAAEKPVLESWPVHQPGDWAAITERPGDAGALAEQLLAVRRMRAELPADVPLLQTVFTPLAILGEMVEEPGELRLHMRNQPNAVKGALEAVTRTFEDYVRRLRAEGIDGLFFATVDWASRNLMSPDDYKTWARPYDERILRLVDGLPFNVLHVCKRRNLLLEFADYPVAAFSYDAHDPTNPPLTEALARMPGAFMGGISQEDALQARTTERVLEELRMIGETTGGRRWLVAPGCSIPPATPAANLKAVRAAADATGSPHH